MDFYIDTVDKISLTREAVISLHIPDPPPVQSKTRPTKRLAWKTVWDGAEKGTHCVAVDTEQT